MTITDTGTRIDLPLLDYSKRRNTQVKECYLTLGVTHFHYKVVAEYEQLNEDTEVWEFRKANHRFTRAKEGFLEVSMYFDNREQLWSVDISCRSDDNAWLFNDPKSALKVYTQLQDYFLGRV